MIIRLNFSGFSMNIKCWPPFKLHICMLLVCRIRNDLFFISANPTSRNEREQWDIRSKKEAFAWLIVPAFCVLIRRLYAGHELVVWSVEWLTEPVYARQDRVMAMHNGTTEAPDS